MKYLYYALSLIPLSLLAAFYLTGAYGPGGWAGVAWVGFFGEAIIVGCPAVTFLGLILIVVEAVYCKKVVGPCVATGIAALPGIIFWVTELRSH